jgi:hypothetical protein
LLSYSKPDYIAEYLGYKAAGASTGTLTIPPFSGNLGWSEGVCPGEFPDS